jgi:hypothetical protein
MACRRLKMELDGELVHTQEPILQPSQQTTLVVINCHGSAWTPLSAGYEGEDQQLEEAHAVVHT